MRSDSIFYQIQLQLLLWIHPIHNLQHKNIVPRAYTQPCPFNISIILCPVKLLVINYGIVRTLFTNVIISDVFNICKIIYGGDELKAKHRVKWTPGRENLRFTLKSCVP